MILKKIDAAIPLTDTGLHFGRLAWEHLMYLREKRRREREQRAREQAEAIVAELQKEVDHQRSELAALKARSHPPPRKE